MNKFASSILLVTIILVGGYLLVHESGYRFGFSKRVTTATSSLMVTVPDAKTLAAQLSSVVSESLLKQTDMVKQLAGKTMRVEKLYAWITKLLDGYLFKGAKEALPRKDVYDPALFILRAIVPLEPVWAESLKELRKQYRKQKKPDHIVDWVCGVAGPRKLIDVEQNRLVCEKPRELAKLLCKRYHVSTMLVYATVFAGSSALPLNKPIEPQELPSLVLDWSKHKDERLQALRTFNGCRTCMLAMTPEAAAVAAPYCLLG